MENLLFEIQAKNYEKVHKEIANLSVSEMDDLLWFSRGISAIGLSMPDSDKLKESVMCLEKVSEIPSEYVNELNNAVEDLKTRYSKSFWAAYDGQMTKDKPDNVNYGLQMIGGELQKNIYIMGKGEALENICKLYQDLFRLIENDEKLLKESINTFKNLLSIGFRKNFKVEQVDWQKPISLYDTKLKELNPNHVSSKQHVEGNCFVATAVYGSYQHPNVWILRKFRDEFLSKHKLGRSFIKFYYKYGMYPAKLIENNLTLNKIVREYILNPLTKYISSRL